MQAIVLDTQRQATYNTDVPIPIPKTDEALIRVTLAGICGTDIQLARGYKGFSGILGHEFVGIVEQCSDSEWIGKRVVGSINMGCQICSTCKKRGPEHCPNRQVVGILHKNGAFADYLTLPIRNLFAVPDGIDDETAVFTEPFAAALHVLEGIPFDLTQLVAVVGPGRLGLLIGLVLRYAGFVVTMLGRSELSLQLPQQLGLLTGYTQNVTDNHFPLVVEATGNPAGLAESLRIIRPEGTLILKSTFADTSQLDLNKIIVSEIKVIGSRCGSFAPALNVLAQGSIPVKETINGRYALVDWQTAVDHAQQSGVRKILLHP